MASAGVLDLSVGEFQIVQRILADLVPGRPVYIFGSRVTGQARRRSDLDLAIGGDGPLGTGLMSDLSEAFDESDLPIEVDVVDVAQATSTFRARIENEWVPMERAAQQLAVQVSA